MSIRKKKSALPISKAKTAYGLLSDVRKAILEEPLRYNQNIYIDRLSGDDISRHSYHPACGTVGCVAGWITVLKGLEIATQSEVGAEAARILGLDARATLELFSGRALADLTGLPPYRLPLVQTPEYAALGARHIRRFQNTYARQLKAKRV